jgi:hypothetical protein
MSTPAEKTDEKKVKVLFSFKPEAMKKAKADSVGKLWFKGIASTEDKDLQGETILADGLDFSYFIENGWFDDEHSKAAADGLGVPTLVETREIDGKPHVYVEGYLYDTKENRRLYRLMKAIKKAGDRTLGLSVQGPVKKRVGKDGKTVAQAWIKNIAITRNPVNPNTYIEAVEKSLGEFADELCKAMGEGSDAGMTAGYPVPTYIGGGSAAPLMKQEMLTATKKAGRKKMKLTIKKAEWEGMTEEVRKSLSDSYAASGIEMELVEDTVVPEGTPEGEVVKSLPEQADELTKALTEAKDVLVAGGVIAPFTVDKVNEFNDAAKVLTDAINQNRDIMQKSVDVLGVHNDRISAIEANFAEMSKSVATALEGIMSAVRVPEMSKSVTGENVVVVEKPNAVTEPVDAVDSKVALGEIVKAFNEADESRKPTLKGFYETVLVNGFKGTKDELMKAIAAA